jgi:hypothetical protein
VPWNPNLPASPFVTFAMAQPPFLPPIGNITVNDPEGHNPIQVTLQVGNNNGNISFTTTAGLTFLQGDGNNDPVVRTRGSIAAHNTAYNGLVFKPKLNFTGPATIVVTVNDLANGNTGKQTSCTIYLQVTAENPTNSQYQPPTSSANSATRAAQTSGSSDGGTPSGPREIGSATLPSRTTPTMR